MAFRHRLRYDIPQSRSEIGRGLLLIRIPFLIGCLFALALCRAPARALEEDNKAAISIPGVPPVKVNNPDAAIRCAAAFVATNFDWEDAKGNLVKGHHAFQEDQTCRIRFFSLWDVAPAEQAQTYSRLLGWWVNQMSFEAFPQIPRVVPGTDGRLLWFDLADYRWNSASWRAVAERELYLVEPLIDHENTEYLRRRLVAPLSDEAKKGREVAIGQGRTERKLLLPAGVMVTATQFIRDTLETDRSDSYYDLLFSEFRFTDVVVEGGAYESKKVEKTRKETPVAPLVPKTPKLYVAGENNFSVELKPGLPFPEGKTVFQWLDEKFVVWEIPKPRPVVEEETVVTRRRSLPQGKITAKFVNFPKDEEDWEKAFGIDKVKAHMKERKIDLDFGAVVEGGQDNPKGGSIVALQNRLLVTVVGPYGAAMETYDVKQATGVKDFSESLIFAGGHFSPGEGAKAFRDAGELLAYLPNGGQAGLLVDGAGKRIEVAGGNIAEDTGSTTKRKDVRNVGSCIVCHAPDGGYIPPNDVIADGASKGIRVKFKDRLQENRVRGFFRDQKAKIAAFQQPYLELLEQTTRLAAKDPKGKPTPGWKGVQLAKEVEAFRKWYDSPLDLKTAAASLGMPEANLKKYLALSPLNRAQQLLKGRSVPRRVWEVDLAPNLSLIRQAEVDEAERKKTK